MTQRRAAELLQVQGELEAALAAYKEYFEIFRPLVDQDSNNPGLQRTFAVAKRKIGDLWEAQRELETAQAAYEESLEIFRRLVDQNPSNASLRREFGFLSDSAAGFLRS